MTKSTHIVHQPGFLPPQISRIDAISLNLLSSTVGTFCRVAKEQVACREWKLLHEGTEQSCREFIATTNLVEYD